MGQDVTVQGSKALCRQGCITWLASLCEPPLAQGPSGGILELLSGISTNPSPRDLWGPCHQKKFTLQGPGRKHGGWTVAVEADLCYPHSGATIKNDGCHLPVHHQPLGEPSAAPTYYVVQERACKHLASLVLFFHIKNDTSF